MILILFLGINNKIYLIYSFYSINSKNGYRRAVYIRIYKKAYKNSREPQRARPTFYLFFPSSKEEHKKRHKKKATTRSTNN